MFCKEKTIVLRLIHAYKIIKKLRVQRNFFTDKIYITNFFGF